MRDRPVYANDGPFEVAVCGDPLTHPRSFVEVETLLGDLRGSLEAGGKLILEVRDHNTKPKGAGRATPVRLDDDRIMARYVEYEAERVNVHDRIFVK